MPVSTIPAANVSSIPQRSPLRYPGGKTWLIPHVRFWLDRLPTRPKILLEPFAGGAIVSLTAVTEHFAERAILVELDPDVAAFWQVAFTNPSLLMERMLRRSLSREQVRSLFEQSPTDVSERAWRTLVLNRLLHNGVLAAGSSFPVRGENDQGWQQRWYPETITRRLRVIAQHADKFESHHADGLAMLRDMLEGHTPGELVVFADPPYTNPDGTRIRRIYTHATIDDGELFAVLASTNAEFLMTYNHGPDVMRLVEQHHFHAVAVPMRTGHHTIKYELVITPRQVFPTWGSTEQRCDAPKPRIRTAALPFP